MEALSSSFETLNDGISLNAQEKRNAIIGKPARKVREISIRFRDGSLLLEGHDKEVGGERPPNNG